jgi:ElaB/YqjD/DUF883 family membrane-anchored ribosome-binding protein
LPKGDHGIVGERDLAKGVEHVKDAAKDMAHSVSDAATYVRHKAEDVTTAVGGAMEDSGHYLRDDGVHKIVAEISTFVRRNPISALLAGVGIGMLIARATHRRGDSGDRNGETHA